MRIAINCRSFLTKNYAGIGRYAHNLVQFLAEIDHRNEYWLYCLKSYFDFKRRIPRIQAPNFHVKVDWLGRGLDRTLKGVDIYHSPSPDFLSIQDARIIVTVHDLIYKTYPHGHTQSTLETTERQMEEIVDKADTIICCSRSTIQDLRRFFAVPEERIRLVYQGVDKTIFYPLNAAEKEAGRQRLKKKGIGDKFLLFVGTIEPRKNLQNLVLAFSELKRKKLYPGQLVVVGMKGWMIEGLDEVIHRLGVGDDVVFPGYVTDSDLRLYYGLCDAFVFPSFYEGFGFPIVEAFSCGAAVITSNVSSCPEIAGDAALWVDPYDPDDIAVKILAVVDDKKTRQRLIEAGLRRAEDFSFRKTAEETLAVYEESLSGTAGK